MPRRSRSGPVAVPEGAAMTLLSVAGDTGMMMPHHPSLQPLLQCIPPPHYAPPPPKQYDAGEHSDDDSENGLLLCSDCGRHFKTLKALNKCNACYQSHWRRCVVGVCWCVGVLYCVFTFSWGHARLLDMCLWVIVHQDAPSTTTIDTHTNTPHTHIQHEATTPATTRPARS